MTVCVAIDDEGNSIPVPDLSVDSERGEQLRTVALDHF
jgi:hypothetical protein